MGCQPPSTAHGLPSQARCAVAAATNGSHILPIGMVEDFAKVAKEARKRKVRMDVTQSKGCILYLPSWISAYLPSVGLASLHQYLLLLPVRNTA